MTAPSLPDGFGETRHIQTGRSDCHITIGFDQVHQQIPRFLLQLHYQTETDPLEWTVIARMDHNEQSATGHDVYQENLHVDVHRYENSTVHLPIRHASLPQNRGIVIRASANYLVEEAQYFIDVYEGRQLPGAPPRWRPDGGETSHTLIRPNALSTDMSQDRVVEDALTLEELGEELAEATGSTPEEIETGAEELTLGRPWEADPSQSED